MPVVTQSAPWSDIIEAGNVLSVAVTVGGGVFVQRSYGGDVIESASVTTSRSFGPYLRDMTFRVSAMAGASATVLESTDTGQQGGSVSGAGDLRRLAKWHKSGRLGDIILCGDSTTERAAGNYGYDGTWSAKWMLNYVDPAVKIYNRGANGQTWQGFVVATTANNAGGVNTALPAVAAMRGAVYVISYGINDCRTDASIIGSYGSAGQRAKAATLRGYAATTYAAIKAQNPDACIVWRMPNAHATGASLITNGVSAQHCMDVYRLTYLGDGTTALPSLEDLYPDSIVVDTLALYYSRTAYASGTPLLDGDGLHEWNALELYWAVLRCLGGATYASLNSTNTLDALYDEQVRAKGEVIGSGVSSAAFDLVCSGTFSGNGTSYVDLQIQEPFSASSTAPTAVAFGAASGGTRGTVSAPALAIGDILVLYRSTGEERIDIVRAPSNNGGGYVRWAGGAPDNVAYPAAPSGGFDQYKVLRPRRANSLQSALMQERFASGGTQTAQATRRKRYLYAMESRANGSAVFRAVYGALGYDDSAGHTLSTADLACAGGLSRMAGQELASATIAAVSGQPGAWTVTLSGVDFRQPVSPLCDVYSAT